MHSFKGPRMNDIYDISSEMSSLVNQHMNIINNQVKHDKNELANAKLENMDIFKSQTYATTAMKLME